MMFHSPESHDLHMWQCCACHGWRMRHSSVTSLFWELGHLSWLTSPKVDFLTKGHVYLFKIYIKKWIRSWLKYRWPRPPCIQHVILIYYLIILNCFDINRFKKCFKMFTIFFVLFCFTWYPKARYDHIPRWDLYFV